MKGSRIINHPGFDPFGLIPSARSGGHDSGGAAEAASNNDVKDGMRETADAHQIQAIHKMNGDNDDAGAEGMEVGSHRELHIWAIPFFRRTSEAENGKESDPGSRILDSLVFLPVTTWQEEESSSGWMQVCGYECRCDCME